jgi:hypothetical protein
MTQHSHINFDILERQKNGLVEKIPALKAFFVDIFLSGVSKPVPFLPLRVMRDFALFTEPPAHIAKTFLSSGSTQATRAQHSFTHAGLEAYALGAQNGFQRFLKRFGMPSNTPLLSLVPHPNEWSQSSLAHMIEMFHAQNFNVTWVDNSSLPSSLFDALAALRVQSDEIIIFGTSFHHLLLQELLAANSAKAAFPPFRRIAVIDTGGTKGRTVAFRVDEVRSILTNLYLPFAQETLFLSEYGMCELASQAWSMTSPHGGDFFCNSTLTPFAIDLGGSSPCETTGEGFLAFIDRNNSDSYMALLTEDLGYLLPKSPSESDLAAFHLVGRSPDSSLKGCSLNVKSHFQFLSKSSPAVVTHFLPKISRDISSSQLEEVLKKDFFPAELFPSEVINDITFALKSWNKIPPLERTREGECALIVASANIPITWLHPARILAAMGVSKIVLALPSLRQEDPLSALIRSQTIYLANALQPLFESFNTTLTLQSAFSLSGFDFALVFGSDETVQNFKKWTSEGNTQYVGLGDVRNAAVATNHSDSAQQLASACSAFYGRGCLTPLVIFIQNSLDSGPWDELFKKEFDFKMSALFNHAKLPFNLFHRHDLLEIKARLNLVNSNSGDSRIFAGKSSLVVDLRKMSPEKLSVINIDVGLAGGGLVFLAEENQMSHALFKGLTFHETQPRIADLHTGKTWMDWLQKI